MSETYFLSKLTQCNLKQNKVFFEVSFWERICYSFNDLVSILHWSRHGVERPFIKL